VRAVKHVIWDWNGTLFDDAWLCVEIINGLLVNRGLPPTDEAHYQDSFVFPVEAYYRSIGFDFAREPFELLTSEYMKQYDRRCSECGLQPEARTVLAALSARGYTHSILSATEQSRLEKMVVFAGLRERFAELAGTTDCYARSKTARGRWLIATLRREPSEVVMVGDTLHDQEVASAIGVECILIPSGHCSRQRMIACGAKVLANLGGLLSLSAL
jgi:phosphoglycolate phosphatase